MHTAEVLRPLEICALQTLEDPETFCPMAMRIMTRRRLREHIDQPRNAAARGPMLTWAAVVGQSAWRDFTDVKRTFPSADLLAGEKVCFDIGGNKWRIIANVAYRPQIVLIGWIGDHSQYDKL